MSDFATRQKEFGLVSFAQTRAALQDPNTVVLDIRRPDEIAADGTLPQSQNIVVSLTDASALQAAAPTALPDKQAAVYIYCRSGRRAATAVQALQAMGYTHVMNGGGWSDVQAALAEEKANQPVSQ